MPLVVHIFRLLMLFLNVYETFKILKPAPPSARKAGQPSLRAVTQRKRDMKGCLAVWIVWCCFATYERTFDIVVSRLVPFYDEFKSLILIFLIITRAKGAEPIFLHVLRPIIKPYTSTLDSLLDLSLMVGDILYILAEIPLRLVLSWWRSLFIRNDNSLEETGHHPGAHETDVDSVPNLSSPDLVSYPSLPAVEPLSSDRRVPTEIQPDARRPVESRHPSASIAHGTVRSRRQVLEAGPKSVDTLVGGKSRVSGQATRASSQRQIWYPPPSSYEPTEEARESPLAQARVPLPPDGYPAPVFIESDTTSEEPSDEWRQYPPFPSAYPPTPLPPTSLSLPLNPSLIQSSRCTLDNIQFPPLPTIPDNVQPQDFARSLLPPRKPLSPGFLDGSSSDDSSMSGIQDQGRAADARSDGAVLGVSDSDDEENSDADNSFNVTLRTPHPAVAARVTARPKTSSVTSTSKSSVLSQSTALTTVHDASSLGTRTSSESSISISISDSSSAASSLARQKRSPPRDRILNAMPRSKPLENGTAKDAPLGRPVVKRPATKGSHIVTRSQQQVLKGLLADSLKDADSEEDSDDGGAWADRIAPGKKRRRVLGPTREASVYSTRTRIPPQDRSTMQQAGSSNSTLSAEDPRIASRASSRLSRRATDPATDSNLAAGPKVVAPRRASDKNSTRKR